MNKFLLKTRYGLFVLLGILAFSFGTTTEMSAQKYLDPGMLGNYKWKTSDDAQAAINSEIATLDIQLKSVQDDALDLKRKFYYSIVNMIEQGSAVPAALDGSFVKFVPGYTDQPVEVPNSLSQATWLGYYQEAAQKLQN